MSGYCAARKTLTLCVRSFVRSVGRLVKGANPTDLYAEHRHRDAGWLIHAPVGFPIMLQTESQPSQTCGAPRMQWRLQVELPKCVYK